MKLVSLFVRPLGADPAPFGHSSKSAEFIAGGLANLFGSVVNMASQNETNETNERNTRKTNEMNYQIAKETNQMSQAQFDQNMAWLREQFESQRKWSLEDRENERAYNSPAKIVERLKAAGINPAAYFGQGATSAPVSSISPVGAPSQSNFHAAYAQAPHAEPVQFDATGLGTAVGRAIDSFHQNKLIDSQTEKTRYESQIERANSATQFMENVARVRNMMVDIDEKLSRIDLNKSQRKVYEAQREQLNGQITILMNTIDDQIKSLQLSNKRVEREMVHLDKVEEGMALDDALKKIDINFKPLIYASGLRMSEAQISEVKQHINNMITEAYNGRLQGMNLSREAIAKDLENKLRQMHVLEESTKHGIKNGKNQATKALYYFADYLGNILGSPLRGLFK